MKAKIPAPRATSRPKPRASAPVVAQNPSKGGYVSSVSRRVEAEELAAKARLARIEELWKSGEVEPSGLPSFLARKRWATG